MQRKDRGFTIAELMIASGVFSLTILVAVAGFLGISRLFYKGVSSTQTTEIARQLLDDVSGSVGSAAFVSPRQTGNGYTYYCLGNNRYTFVRDSSNLPIQLNLAADANYDPASPGVNLGLLKDALPGSSACAAPCPSAGSCPVGASPLNNPQELLGDKMWLADLAVNAASVSTPDLYIVDLVLVYGERTAINFDETNPQNDACVSSADQAYCSVVKLSTAVRKGVAQ